MGSVFCLPWKSNTMQNPELLLFPNYLSCVSPQGDTIISRIAVIFRTLTLKALGFFLPVQHWGEKVFSTPPPSVRLDPDILESRNLQG